MTLWFLFQVEDLYSADFLVLHYNVGALLPGRFSEVAGLEYLIFQSDSCTGNPWILPGRRDELKCAFK